MFRPFRNVQDGLSVQLLRTLLGGSIYWSGYATMWLTAPSFFVISRCSFFFSASISRVIYSIVEVKLKNEVGHHP
jgi:hypothetical protein